MSFPLGLSGSVLPRYARVYLLRRLATCDLLVREQGDLGAVGVSLFHVAGFFLAVVSKLQAAISV